MFPPCVVHVWMSVGGGRCEFLCACWLGSVCGSGPLVPGHGVMVL